MEVKKNYQSLSGESKLSETEMFSLKAGAGSGIGCRSYVCATNREGAAEACRDGYCYSQMGPVSSQDTITDEP